LKDCGVEVAVLGLGYAAPWNITERPFGAVVVCMSMQIERAHIEIHVQDIIEVWGSRDAICARGMAAIIRSGLPSFLLIFVRQAIVSVGHFRYNAWSGQQTTTTTTTTTHLISFGNVTLWLKFGTYIKAHQVLHGAGRRFACSRDGVLARETCEVKLERAYVEMTVEFRFVCMYCKWNDCEERKVGEDRQVFPQYHWVW
jgi:hypothetical protein